MALQAKAIRSKISSVKNIRKITRAMEMVAATKMRKATRLVIDSKEFINRANELLSNLSSHRELSHVLLSTPKNSQKTLVVGISSNRGLCGAYNTNIRKAISNYVKEHKNESFSYIAMGKFVERTMKKLPGELLASFTDLGDFITEEELWSVNSFIVDEFKKGIYKNVILFYTRFNSSLSYTPLSKHILPIRQKDLEETMSEIGIEKKKQRKESFENFVYEPGHEEVLDFILPRITEVYIYQALLEGLASEHSSRMVAMKSASDNAKKLIEMLTINFNRARQAGITQEIAEISAGSITN